MASSAFLLRSLISNPNKISTNFVLKPSLNLITRPFSSYESIPNSPNPNPNPNPPISADPVSKLTKIDPFSKEQPVNQKKLVEENFKARTDGLFVTAASKVMERMSRRLRPFQNNDTKLLTHEAMAAKPRSHDRTPEVVAHIAVLEAYANAGQTHDSANRVYRKMLGAGVIPNQHTYNMLIQLLASISNGDWMMIGQAQKYLLEMLDKGMRPEAPTSVAIFKALAKEGRVREGKEFLEDLQRRGFVVDNMVFKEVFKGRGTPLRALQGKNGPLIKTVLEILFDKKL